MALMVCAGLSSCAPTHFTAPSFQPTRAAITSAQGHTSSAQGHTTKAQGSVKSASEHAGKAASKTGQLQKNLAAQPENLKLAQEVRGELDQLTQSLLDASNELAQTQANLKQTQADLGVSQQKLTKAEGETIAMANKANAAIADADRQKVKYHRLKAGACGLAAAAVGFVAFHFGKYLVFLGPWAWAVLLGAPVATFAALWFIL